MLAPISFVIVLLPSDQDLLDRIWKSWEDRQASIKTIRFDFVERSNADDGSSRRSNQSVTLGAENNAKVVIEYIHRVPDKEQRRSTVTKLASGDVYLTLIGFLTEVRPRAGGRPYRFNATVSPRIDHWSRGLAYRPLKAFVRPLHDAAKEEFTVNAEEIRVDSYDCVTVIRKEETTSSNNITTLQVASALEYLPVRIIESQFSKQDQLLAEMTTSLTYNTDGTSPVPRAWSSEMKSIRFGRTELSRSSCVCTKVEVNPQLSDDFFQVELPAGTSLKVIRGEKIESSFLDAPVVISSRIPDLQ